MKYSSYDVIQFEAQDVSRCTMMDIAELRHSVWGELAAQLAYADPVD